MIIAQKLVGRRQIDSLLARLYSHGHSLCTSQQFSAFEASSIRTFINIPVTGVVYAFLQAPNPWEIEALENPIESGALEIPTESGASDTPNGTGA